MPERRLPLELPPTVFRQVELVEGFLQSEHVGRQVDLDGRVGRPVAHRQDVHVQVESGRLALVGQVLRQCGRRMMVRDGDRGLTEKLNKL